jgi:hypothetical protein
LRIEADKIANYKPQKRPAPQPQPQYQQQAPAKPQVDPRALEWGKKNTWFENPETPEMTGYAYGVHQKLVQSGIDPNTDQYYTEIDKAMRQVFPDKFDDGQGRGTSTPTSRWPRGCCTVENDEKITHSATYLNASLSRQAAWTLK